MRAALLTAALLTALASCAQWGSEVDEREQERILKNRIKSKTVVSINYEDGVLAEPHYWWTEVFDRKGRFIRSTSRHAWQAIGTIMQCDTDAQGTVTHCLQQQFDDEGLEVEYANESYHDAAGRCVRSITYSHGTIKNLYAYTYGEHGLVLEEMMLPDSTVIHTIRYAYDTLGNPIEYVGMTSDVDSAGQRFFYLDSKYLSTHDAHGREVVRTNITLHGISTRCFSRYDEQGKLIEFCVRDPDGTERGTQRFVYDEDGNKIEFRNEPPGTTMRREVTTYDEKGNPIQSIHYRGEEADHLYRYTYEYHPR